MAAFVVLAASDRINVPGTGERLNIFPGSATPTVFPAGKPFWIGYGFIRHSADLGKHGVGLDDETRFELDVDQEPTVLSTDVTFDDGEPVSRFSVANFGSGLPVGWHRFQGRWYDRRVLVLTSDKSVEFVER
jgi:hypothetical protein